MTFRMPHQTCPIIRMKNIFPKVQATNFIRYDFKHRQAINRMFILMRSAGIVKRQELKFKEKTLKKNYESKREYKVHVEGVQFAHVRYIVIGYFLIIPIVLLIAVCENIHYRMKYRRQPAQEVRSTFEVLDVDLLEEIANY